MKNLDKKNHTQLLCNVGELSGLFTDSTSLEGFLQRIVEMVAEHMHTDVSSIYLFNAKAQELVLRATKGLNEELIGNITLKAGEGLTGLALRDLKPVCEKNASTNKNFKHFPELGEEKFESFLAVPIVHGRAKIGVMVVQNTESDYFTDVDINVLSAITSQLANTIEMTSLILGIDQDKVIQPKNGEGKDLTRLDVTIGAMGIVLGSTVVVHDDEVLTKTISDTKFSFEDLEKAFSKTEKQLEDMQEKLEEKLSDVASLIFSAQILMLKDKAFVDAIRNGASGGLNPPESICQVVNDYVNKFSKISNPHIRDKMHDIRDIGRRLMRNLIGAENSDFDNAGKIVIANELLPSDILKLSSQQVKGVVVLHGGSTGHLAILAQSLQIPLVIIDEPALMSVTSRTEVLIDGVEGILYVNPSDKIKDSYAKHLNATRETEVIDVADTTQTSDGTEVKLLANINLLSDLSAAHDYKAQGVGLYRTEFPFIVRHDFPSEEEQYVVYKKLIDGMAGREVTIRSLDIGGDKVLGYFEDSSNESNPFLGLRSIRFSLKYRDIFKQQIRAVLRAAFEADVRLMFPMISSTDEFCEAKEVVGECATELRAAKVDFKEEMPLGMMVELPAVVDVMDGFVEVVDFFSIGTNDFIQYMLAVDRTNEKVSKLYVPHHPSVLKALFKIVQTANAHNKPISICGDMVKNERYTEFLLGIGLRRFSLSPRSIGLVQRRINQIDLSKAKKVTAEILKLNSLKELNKIFT
ncbi:MAG: phosphotransferase system enzyme I (PtsP) [Lysobacterales bacterium]|jgi:phosphotransferase system enzyme I (PtsP)